MPLVWAHAEYIKLLRSAANGQPFDFIPIVGDRYLAGAGRKDLKIWKPSRQVRHVALGQTLRIQAPRPFRLHWSMDQWNAVADTESKETGSGISYVDLPVGPAERKSIRFTFLWMEERSGKGAITKWASYRGNECGGETATAFQPRRFLAACRRSFDSGKTNCGSKCPQLQRSPGALNSCTGSSARNSWVRLV